MYVTYFSSKYHCTFVVESTLDGFLWHKYESGKRGSSNNMIIYKNKKNNVSHIKTVEDLVKLIEQN